MGQRHHRILKAWALPRGARAAAQGRRRALGEGAAGRAGELRAPLGRRSQRGAMTDTTRSPSSSSPVRPRCVGRSPAASAGPPTSTYDHARTHRVYAMCVCSASAVYEVRTQCTCVCRVFRAHAAHMHMSHVHAHVHVHVTCSAHAVHMRCTCSAPAVHMQCTCYGVCSPRRGAYLDHQRAVEGAAQRLGDAARDGILSHVDTERRPHDAAVRDDLTDDAAHLRRCRRRQSKGCSKCGKGV